MAKLYVGNLPPGIPEYELEREFSRYGRCKVWVARKPPGFGASKCSVAAVLRTKNSTQSANQQPLQLHTTLPPGLML